MPDANLSTVAKDAPVCDHARAISMELAWLAEVIEGRLQHFFAGDRAEFAFPAPPALPPASALGQLVDRTALTGNARLILALALAPHVHSAILDPFFVKNKPIDRVFSQFGGVISDNAFYPTAQTALFLVAGADSTARIQAMHYFDVDNPLRRYTGLELGAVTQTAFAATLQLPVHRVVALCEGSPPRPDFAPGFPAKRLETGLDWADLALPRDLHHNLGHIIAWLENRDRILGDWGLSRHFGEGFKALFYGPPGTGKTLTASLLGKRTGLDVYRVDLSMVVSKYIGETEKNLGVVFDMAAEREWILFFDEADALFGSRTATTSSNDRYANQEVSYLLQRIEDCRSLVILATNLRGNIDDAFFRRFQMALGFSRPDKEQRKQIWSGLLAHVPVAGDVDIDKIAQDHGLVGGSITNVVRHAAITALRRNSETVSKQDIQSAISSEMRKEGRTA
ncbi:ATP-dependent zinc metalloprotease FtsH [Roseobacter fucihabitans]|uniref:ATP-dependent zinc metalloprotease FtsH n=1 Tax=Roseobacter fucihabitans TaxID=1537242 RepID=A0ABZ2BLV3_9RHOB|nr:ATP-binding protein [Roseobacter litoralis]MBC6963416.1 ATP-dependent zinc metalloprotease FtsH 3 [Roseobacter litoralis]